MPLRRPLRVLVADDEALVINLIASELAEAGYAVAGRAHDGRRVVALAKELRPDVILMDISMPEQDGIAAAAQIQDECPTAIVVLSAHEDQADIERAQAAGVGAYLAKPPLAADLHRAISIARARHADLQELRRLNAELREALAQVKTLRGLLPMCSYCKKIRDDRGYWNQLETYLSAHAGANFTHAYCPDCVRQHFPDVAEADGESGAEPRPPGDGAP